VQEKGDLTTQEQVESGTNYDDPVVRELVVIGGGGVPRGTINDSDDVNDTREPQRETGSKYLFPLLSLSSFISRWVGCFG